MCNTSPDLENVYYNGCVVSPCLQRGPHFAALSTVVCNTSPDLGECVLQWLFCKSLFAMASSSHREKTPVKTLFAMVKELLTR